MRRRGAALALLFGGLVGLAAPSAAQTAKLGGQFRYWAFNNHNDLRDVLGYWAQGPLHVQLEYWDFVRGDDVFRPEIGLHLRDRRRSVTTLQWRHERRRQDRFTLATDQVLNDRWVARGEVSPIVTPDSTEWVIGAGLDFYWASYSFAQVTVIRDPRGDGLWVVPLRMRLATEANDWVQVTVAPASQRTLGWAVDTKARWLRLGVERNSRFDFTDLDNTIYTIGFELALPRGK